MPRGNDPANRVSRGALMAENGALRKQLHNLELKCERLEQGALLRAMSEKAAKQEKQLQEMMTQIVVIAASLRQIRSPLTNTAADRLDKILQLAGAQPETWQAVKQDAVAREVKGWGAAATETPTGQAAEIKRLKAIIDKEATWLEEHATAAPNPLAAQQLATRASRLRELIGEGKVAPYLRGSTV